MNYLYRLKAQQPTAENLTLMADYFNVSVDHLLSKELLETYRLEIQNLLEVYKGGAKRGVLQKIILLSALSSTFNFYKQLIFFKMEISFNLLS